MLYTNSPWLCISAAPHRKPNSGVNRSPKQHNEYVPVPRRQKFPKTVISSPRLGQANFSHDNIADQGVDHETRIFKLIRLNMPNKGNTYTRPKHFTDMVTGLSLTDSC